MTYPWYGKYMNLDHRIPDQSNTKDWNLIATRRAQLFDAASVVFSQRGYHKATMREIADWAGMSKGNLYEYVESKKDLLFLVVEEGYLRLLENIVEVVEGDGPPEEKLLTGIRIQVSFINNYLDAAQVLMPEVEGLAGEDKKRMDNLKSNYLNVFSAIYEEGIRKGVFRDMNSMIASEIICNACMLWGKSDSIRERCESERDYENFLVSLFLKGFQT